MSRTPFLTTLLWTTVGVAALGACGEDNPQIIDAAPVDSTADAYVGPLAQFPAALALTAECGVPTPPTADLTIQNVGTTALTISGATATGGFTVEAAFPLEIAAGASAAVAVRPPAAVIGTDVGGAVKNGVLSFNTNQPGTTGTVALTSTVQGANLVFEDAAHQPISQLELADATGACPAPATVFIHNTGNLEATLTNASSSTGFTVGGFTPSSAVAAGATVSHELRALTFGSCTAADGVQYQVTGTVCTTTPLVLQASLNITGASSCFCS